MVEEKIRQHVDVTMEFLRENDYPPYYVLRVAYLAFVDKDFNDAQLSVYIGDEIAKKVYGEDSSEYACFFTIACALIELITGDRIIEHPEEGEKNEDS